MKLYNTLTRKIEELKPIKTGEVSVYSCGPTVYDNVHIGNLRAFIVSDLLKRALRASGLKVAAIMNITDIDDKTIARSREIYPNETPEEALKLLTRKYEAIFMHDADAIGIDLKNTKLIRATDSIEQMQELINQIGTDYAYVSEGSVYFDIAKYATAGFTYGVLTNVDYSPQARVDNDEYDKQDARDFVLWKGKKDNEPSWVLEFDGQKLPGRPGWHIECSAMSAELGTPFDIHTGGIDLVFPHHEDEIAQTTAATGKPLANMFVHNEHLLVDGKKMSKREQNFFVLDDIIGANVHPLVFRLLMLSAHYRSQQNFTFEALGAAEAFLERLYALADRLIQPPAPYENQNVKEAIKSFKSDFLTAINNDLATPQALATLSELLNELEPVGLSQSDLAQLKEALQLVDDTLGLKLLGRPDISDEAKKLLIARQIAREEKDFAEADKLRDELSNLNIDIDDTPYGYKWRRASK